jgi:hypothetical protein
MDAAAGPPDDPEAWSDDEWLAWLSSTDVVADEAWGRPAPSSGPAAERLPVSGKLLYAGMRGLFYAIYGRVDEPAIVIEASGGDPDLDEPVEVVLDPDHPEDSTVVVRPWLMDPDV